VPGSRNTTRVPASSDRRAAVREPRAATTAAPKLTKPADLVAELVRDLVEEVCETHPFLTGEGGEVLLDLEVDGIRCTLVAARPEADPAVVLSPREQEIARMVAQGYPNKTIAAVLEISSWTVSTHLRRVFAKLGVRSRAAMVARLFGEHLLR
jgi:DNA-binding CsgD family transcriptional regulator